MKKTLAEEIREMMNRVEEAMGRHYDMELELENWQDDSDEETITLGINYKITGRYRPATWGDRGGDPPEYPELDDAEYFNAKTGQPIQIPEYLEDQVEQAIWKDAEARKKDIEVPDNF